MHITSVLAKVTERAIGNPLVEFLTLHGYGHNQWAFRKLSSTRDLMLMIVTQWILAICTGRKIGTYLGDITGAFDRVYKDFLLAKLYSAGVADVYLNFLNAYLSPRVGYVAIEGVFSDLMVLADTVFQGSCKHTVRVRQSRQSAMT